MKIQTMLTRGITVLVILALCISPVSALNILNEQDFEVLPDYAGMDTETAITTFLAREMKLSDAAVCGILANMEYESALEPDIWGDGGTSYGLCQWHESRCRSLFSFCWKNGYDAASVLGQMKYLRYELEEEYPFVLNYLKTVENSSSGAFSAAWCWCYYYEIPAQRDLQASLRGNLAYEKYLIRNASR